ncbi:MAG: metallophosphoesterase family protein [Pyrobaculum sp.]|jgi:3',5'-cyclic AMP phosphodiesterase CpdA
MRALFLPLLAAAFLLAVSIVDPKWGTPIYITHGGFFNVTLDAPVAVREVALAAPGASLIRLNFTASGAVVTAYVPPGTPPGLYDVVINGGEIYEPKAVWVGNVTGPLKILQLTDVHVGVELDMASLYRLIHGVLYANAMPFDVVFFTGDQADVGGQPWHHVLFVRYASMITKPVFVVPGNHDHAGDDPLVNYRKYQGLPYWYRVVGPYLIIGLDTGFDGYLTDEQVKFYESVLARHPDKVKIVLMHHPPFYLRNAYVVETYRGPQDIDRLSRDPTGRRPYYLVYTSHLQNRAGFEKFLNLTFRYKVAVVMSGHVHGGNSTIIINGTYFVTTRTLGGSIDTSHGFRTYVVYPNGTVKVDPEVWTYKKFAVVTWGSKAAQIYIDSNMVSGTLAVDLPGDYAGLKTFNGTADLVKAEKHPLGKYTRYVIKLSGQPIWVVVGEYAPAPKITVERILPRSPTPGDVVTLTIRAEDPNVGIPFLVINGTRLLASYLEEQPAYLYKFIYKAPTTVPIQAPGGTPITIQIGQPTTTQTTPPVTTPTATPTTTQTTPTPTATTPTPTPTPTTAPTPTPTPSPTGAVSASTPAAATPTVTSSVVTVAPAAPSGLPVEVVALVAIAVVGAVVLALLARKK